MINSLTGTVTDLNQGRLLLRIGGIEWDLTISATTAQQLAGTESDITIYTYLHHREDQLGLYGFATERERELFLNLIKVSGIGPKQASKILSGMDEKLFLACVDQGDADALAAIPGLGKKTAQKIILALRGKLADREGESGAWGDVINALADMGFDRKAASAEVSRLAADPEISSMSRDTAEQEILRRAIVRLSS